MTRYQQVNRIQTHSQQWARENRACGSGRAALGHKSIGEYWRSASANPWHLFWIANHLKTSDPMLQGAYNSALLHFVVVDTGRWKTKQTREGLLTIMSIHDAVLPAVLL